MPTYEYQCSRCGHELEAFQSMSAAPLKKCPSCGKTSLKRLISAGAGIIFKGGGFYETDYKRPAEKKGGEASESSGKDGGGEGSKESAKESKKSEPTKENPKTD
jgi:putative FmdB family regulatory protein